MSAATKGALTSVKGSFIRHPAVIGAGVAALLGVLAANAAAFARGTDAPWLLSAVIIADMLVIGVGILFAAREVLHAEERTEASEARLAAIVDSAMDAVITVDEQQNIVLFNRAAEHVFRVRREEMLGTPLDRLLPTRFRGAHRGHIEGFGRTGVTSRRMGDVTTLWALRGDEEFPIEASISQAIEGGKRYFTVILRDITLRKQHEDALRESQRELRDPNWRSRPATRKKRRPRVTIEATMKTGRLKLASPLAIVTSL
jgi:PAS domain S-box-containing protein